jgi:NhaA family Na+:H+ antiporter
VLGKPLGILAASALALRLRLGALPGSLTLRQLPGVAVIAGIGFTVALFVADLTFAGDVLGQAKAAVLVASVVAAALGSLVVRRTFS